MNNNVLGRGFFRKSKAYGLICGIVLGAAFLGGQVSADEVMVDNSVNAVEEVTSQTIVEPLSENMQVAISVAKNFGVEVVSDATETVESQEEAQLNYVKQTDDLIQTIVRQKEINSSNEVIKEKNNDLVTAQSEAENQAEQTNNQAEQFIKEYEAKVDEQIIDYGDGKTANGYKNGAVKSEAISKSNEEAVKSYLAKKEAVAVYNAKVKQRENDLKNNNIASDESQKLYVIGQFNDGLTGLDYYKNIKVVTLDSSVKTVKSLGWQENTTLTNPVGLTVSEHDTSKDLSVHGTTSDFLYSVQDVTPGDTFKLNNIGTTTDGTNINALVTITNGSKMSDASNSWFLIGKTLDNGIAVDYWNYDHLGMSFKFLDDADNEIKLVVASVVGDVDNDQTSRIEFEGNILHYVNPDGSNLVMNADKSLTGLGFDVDGYQHAPRGTYLMVGSSTTVNYTHSSDPGVLGSKGIITNYIEFDLFGTASMVETESFEYLPQPELVISKVNLPGKAVLTNLQDNLKIGYHLNEYQVPLTTVKDVLNSQGISVDGGELKLGETGHYTLEGAKILANGKDTLVKYDFEDNLDVTHDDYKGYRIYAFVPITLKDGTVIQSGEDLKAYAQAVYDDVTGRFYVSLNSDFLAQVAKDSDFQAKVDIEFVRIASGDVDNIFTNILAFEDEKGNVTEVSVPSNEVTTYTPEEVVPVKETFVAPTSELAEVPVAQQYVLPETGQEDTTMLSVFGAGILAILGLFGISKRKKV